MSSEEMFLIDTIIPVLSLNLNCLSVATFALIDSF